MNRYGVTLLFVLNLFTSSMADVTNSAATSTAVVIVQSTSTYTPTTYLTSTTILYPGSSTSGTTTLPYVTVVTGPVTTTTTSSNSVPPSASSASSTSSASISLSATNSSAANSSPALGAVPASSKVSPTPSSSGDAAAVPAQGKSNAVAIGAGVGGGVGGIALLIAVCLLCCRNGKESENPTTGRKISGPKPIKTPSEPASSIAMLVRNGGADTSASNWNHDRFDDGMSIATTARYSIAPTVAATIATTYGAPSTISAIETAPPIPTRSPYRDTSNTNRYSMNSMTGDEEIRRANAKYNQGPQNATSSGLNTDGRNMSPPPLNINKQYRNEIPSIEYGQGGDMMRRNFADPPGPGQSSTNTYPENDDDASSFHSQFSSQSMGRSTYKSQYNQYPYSGEGSYRYSEEDDPSPNAYREEQSRIANNKSIEEQRRETEDRLTGRWRGY